MEVKEESNNNDDMNIGGKDNEDKVNVVDGGNNNEDQGKNCDADNNLDI